MSTVDACGYAFCPQLFLGDTNLLMETQRSGTVQSPLHLLVIKLRDHCWIYSCHTVWPERLSFVLSSRQFASLFIPSVHLLFVSTVPQQASKEISQINS